MGKIKKMITGVAITFLCGMAVFVSGNTCLATGESYNTATEPPTGIPSGASMKTGLPVLR